MSWRERAICRGLPSDLFFPETESGVDAIRICRGCPVRIECALEALDDLELQGVWGGFSARARRKIRRRLDEASASVREARIGDRLVVDLLLARMLVELDPNIELLPPAGSFDPERLPTVSAGTIVLRTPSRRS